MAPEEEPKPEMTQQQPGARSPARRDRRPSRGRRGRGRGGRPKPVTADRSEGSSAPAVAPQEEPEAIFELAAEADQTSDAATERADGPEPLEEHPPEPPRREPGQRAPTATVEQAIEEVSAVVESLRTSLDEMEEVLELLELFERQKNADEREIESLRRAVRQINRPRDTGHHHHR